MHKKNINNISNNTALAMTTKILITGIMGRNSLVSWFQIVIFVYILFDASSKSCTIMALWSESGKGRLKTLMRNSILCQKEWIYYYIIYEPLPGEVSLMNLQSNYVS